MKLEYFILGLLKLNPCTGYDIKKFLDTEGRFARKRAPLSQIYTTLKRMYERGWVYFEEEQREGTPDAKIYYNTEAGEKAFMEYLLSPVEPSFRFRESDIMFRMMYSFLIEPEIMLKNLQIELDYRRDQIAKFRPRDRTIHSVNMTDEQKAYVQELFEMLHQFGANAIDEYVESLEAMVDFIQKRLKVEEL